MKLKVLVVDDRDLIRDVFAEQLIAHGYLAQPSGSLNQALDMIESWKPDFVFLDLRMPEHDGFKVMNHIQSRFPHPPQVIAMTGEADSDVRQRVEQAGFADFLLKPFRIAKALLVLRELTTK